MLENIFLNSFFVLLSLIMQVLKHLRCGKSYIVLSEKAIKNNFRILRFKFSIKFFVIWSVYFC